MTDTTNLRGRLTNILNDVDDTPDDGMFDTEPYVDDIIDAVREGLMSRKATDAAWDAIENVSAYARNEAIARWMMSAALDAITNGGDDG